MKHDSKWYHHAATVLAKKITRKKGICEKCSRTNETNQMHGSHILSTGAYPGMSAYLGNLLCLCASCHKKSPNSWHNEPLQNNDWFEQKWPGRKQELYLKAQTMVKVDWEQIYNDLKELDGRA